MSVKKWSSVNALYQVYPRSFYDTNSDGVGDLNGIRKKLSYLKGGENSLGVDAIWISPIYPSPMADFGYDVSDYCDIHPLFGTLDEFKSLLKEAHDLDIKVMMDFVPNHTSDQHPWFIDSLKGPDSDMRDYYVWRDPKPDGSPPNNWISIFGGSMWQRDDYSGQYYLHSFLKDQPDLNWDNPKVVEEMQKVLRFWLDLGVDGFRADAVWHMAKDDQMRDNPVNPDHKGTDDEYGSLIHTYSRYGKKLFQHLKSLTNVLAEYEDRIMVFENYPDPEFGDVIKQYRAFYDIAPSIAMPFNFEAMYLPWGANNFGDFLERFYGMLRDSDTPVFCLSNHDQSRIVSRFGYEQARLMAIFLLTQAGLPTIYYGDEVGMEDGAILPHQVQDPSGKNNPMGGRDPERTPMHWSNDARAGFTDSIPWLPVANTSKTRNVDVELREPDSFLNLYKKLLELRSRDESLLTGSFKKIDSDNINILAYERIGQSHYQIVMNFSNKKQSAFVSYRAKVICASHPSRLPVIDEHGEVTLRPYEAIIVSL